MNIEDLLPDSQPLAALWHSARDAVETVAVDCRYAGYVARQQAAAARAAEMEARAIPAGLDYGDVPHLRAEARERLGAIRPETIGQATRISGITPADVTVLLVHLAGAKRQ